MAKLQTGEVYCFTTSGQLSDLLTGLAKLLVMDARESERLGFVIYIRRTDNKVEQ